MKAAFAQTSNRRMAGHGHVALGRRRAFTLLEMVVVLAIVVILSTMALYSYVQYRRSLALESSARLVQQMLMVGRARAITTALPQDVVISLDADTFWVDAWDATRTTPRRQVVPETATAENVVIESVTIGGSTFTTGLQAIPFEPDGSNPLVIVDLRRDFDDPLLDASYFSVQLLPTSSEAQIRRNDRFP